MSSTPTFSQYLRRRGYRVPMDASFVSRMFLHSWAQPGMQYFWRVWNPALGYALFRLYHRLGGNDNRIAAAMTVFALCGIGHDLVLTMVTGRWSILFLVMFTLCGAISLLCAGLPALCRWFYRGPVSNTAMNVSLLLACFMTGVVVNRLAHGLFA